MTIVVILMWILKVARWTIVFFFGLFLYRKFKLPSLPWIAAYFLASVIPPLFMPLIISGWIKKALEHPQYNENFYRIIYEHCRSHPEAYKLAAGIFQWSGLFGVITYLLLTILVISEIVYIISLNNQIEIPETFRFTLKIRNKVTLIGTVIVLITLLSPFFTLFAISNVSN